MRSRAFPTARTTPRARSSRPPYGSRNSLRLGEKAIALIVKSRRARSSSKFAPNKMLDGAQHVADQPRVRAAPTAPADASLADAAAWTDAGVAVDAGMDRAKMLEIKTNKRRRHHQVDQQRQEPIEEAVPVPDDHHNIPKPYGAPPARRRLV